MKTKVRYNWHGSGEGRPEPEQTGTREKIQNSRATWGLIGNVGVGHQAASGENPLGAVRADASRKKRTGIISSWNQIRLMLREGKMRRTAEYTCEQQSR